MAHDPYIDPTTGTLKNKRDIANPKDLSKFERHAAGVRGTTMIVNPVAGNLDFDHLKDIHKTLFQDVYEWAGQTRTINIAKTVSFAPVHFIESHAKKVFGDLATDNHLQGLPRNQFLDRAAHHLGEIDALHPFREGNGRTQRAFMDQVAGRAGYRFEWSSVTQKEMIDASVESFLATPKKMRALLDKALIEPLKDKQRQARLDELVAADPKAHKTIVGMRDKLLQLSEQNVGSIASRERLANSVTDRLLDHHAKGKDVAELAKSTVLKINRSPDEPGRSR